ncbi:DNA alkylation repair protein [candidate division WWE3 bacterium RIFOXYA12_FULL_43_11]|uniref:DNA alkylation repair protein n=1 Tax=candidate division WWE3 bacterium TaxID=2053526 RepID=A0A3D0ZPN5_UNCKA|nr:MAG: hypothetical protein US30_C0029G0006 [Candidatus Moranbacteria bacterium GW2011_GWF2_36_839]OGC58377.1 MAG: DNA alkylation repair protein [candidate division WWE3 bacterium RIFOXYA2_FULL_43_12]OGC65215.1 MAG: DNA alkylation repair protein [candidate division WWE3 bacterium RIFOXYA12_FULL_43_11]OGC72164.1 MAG: DNA alkylation repair protein [candidate division WWE3 bacterium RIFOXYB2_FULL_43_9]OGC74353.1 MAG: DNA alkylation repair protein [candidate division WWE3 bacterium RIFOXYD2_FULL_4
MEKENVKILEKTQLVPYIRTQLKKNSDAKIRTSFQRFFKEPVLCYGVKSGIVGKIARENFAHVSGLSKKELFSTAEDLFKSGYCEESWIAADWIHRKNDCAESDFSFYERWIDKYIDNWAECDTFCNHTVGAFIAKYPKYVSKLKVWAKNKNLWLRRAAAVSLIIPAKEGKFLKDIFEIADILLLDKDDMVQKGYGWMLKEASRLHQKEVLDYVLRHKDDMPRTALRYAIEKMPESLRKHAMAK